MLATSLSTLAAIALVSEMVGQGAGQPLRLQQLGLLLFEQDRPRRLARHTPEDLRRP